MLCCDVMFDVCSYANGWMGGWEDDDCLLIQLACLFCLFGYLSVCLFCLYVYLPVHLFVCLSTYLRVVFALSNIYTHDPRILIRMEAINRLC